MKATRDSLLAPLVLIVSYGRPTHLWSCLDALYRQTRTPARFVLIDNWHPDRQVDNVIEAFRRRGLLSAVHRFSTNTVDNLRQACEAELAHAGPEFVWLEGDACVVDDGQGCWLREMQRIFRTNPGIGMLGSLIDVGDFVSEATCRTIAGVDRREMTHLAKLESPERAFITDASWRRADRDFFHTEPPCPLLNPPGRFLMLDTNSMGHIGLRKDGSLSRRFRELGFRPAITARIRHRHLSLLNIFDYPEYSADQRRDFFGSIERGNRPDQGSRS